MPFTWNTESVSLLKKLWSEGVNAREIAQKIAPENLTRNAVIGKAYRLGLKTNKKTSHTPPRMKFKIPKDRECSWPIGHPSSSDFAFCLAPSVEGKSYCKEHCDAAYRKSSE